MVQHTGYAIPNGEVAQVSLYLKVQFPVKVLQKVSEMKAESSEKSIFCPSFSTSICTGFRTPYEKQLALDCIVIFQLSRKALTE